MEGDDSVLRITAFGGLSLDIDGRELTDQLPLKASVLAVYLADRRQAISRSTLAGLLWSDTTEDRARARLRVTLTRMRSLLGDRLVTDRASVRLSGPIESDVDELARGTPGGAITIYRGPFLDGVDLGDGDSLLDEWATSRRRELHDLATARLADGAREAADRSDWAAAMPFLRRALALEPWNERAHRDVIRAVTALDGRAAGLMAYRTCVERLAEDLGVEPDSETVALAESLSESAESPGVAPEGAATPTDPTDAALMIEQAHRSSADGDHTRSLELLDLAIATLSRPGVTSTVDGIDPTAEIDALDELRLSAIEDFIEAEIALGAHRAVVARAEMFAARHPTRERAWANLMLVRYRCGRQTEALAAYEQLVDRLAEDGVEPSPLVRTVLLQIVGQSDAASLPEWSNGRPIGTTDVPLPAGLHVAAPTSLVGRDAEVDSLTELLATVEKGSTATAFVAGEPGIGKTRLTAAVASQAIDRGFTVLYGRSDEGLSVPYRAWREALGDLAAHIPAHLVRRHFERFGSSLRLLMPALASAGARYDASENSVDQQQLLFEATAEMLGTLARQRPILLVLDDLQWAEGSTLALVRQVVRRVDAPLAVVGLYRSTEVDGAHPVADLVGAMTAAGRCEVLNLGGLDHQAHVDIVTQTTGASDVAIVERIAHRLADVTGGNPFYSSSILSAVTEADAMKVLADGDLSAIVPSSVQRVVALRVRRLGEETAGLLDVASVFGREFDLEVLTAAVGADPDDTLDLLEGALAAGLVIDAPAGRNTFSFAHDLVHHTLAGELSDTRRRRHHQSAADALVAVHGPDLHDRVGEVAEHLLAAGDPRHAAETTKRCLEAARHAAARHAPLEAVTWLERGVARVHAADGAAAIGPLLVELGTQQRNSSNPAHRETLIRAGDLAIENGDHDTLVAAALANSRGMNSHVWEIDLDRIRILRAALGALDPGDSPERADVLASLANEQWDAAHTEETGRLYREATEMARRVDDPATLARVLIRVSRARNVKLPRTELTDAAAVLRELAPIHDVSDPLLTANALTTVLNTSLRLGIAEETFAAIEAIEEAAERLPLPMFTAAAHLARCLAVGLRGDIDEYLQASTDTYHHLVSIEDEEASFIFEGQMFLAAYLRGDLAPILDFAVNVMNERPEVPLYRAAATLISVAAGEHEQARRLLDAEVEQGIEPSVDMFQIQGLSFFADAAATLENRAACERLHAVLAQLTTETTGHLVQVGEPIDICLGRMATVLGRFDEAERHFDVALAVADDFGGVWMRARTLAAQAEMLVKRRREGDADAARVVAAEAESLAVAGDYREVCAAARRVLAALG